VVWARVRERLRAGLRQESRGEVARVGTRGQLHLAILTSRNHAVRGTSRHDCARREPVCAVAGPTRPRAPGAGACGVDGAEGAWH
jgi:hypothetical protein